MGTGTRSTIIEMGRSLAVAAIVAGAGTVLLASRLEERVKANQEEARRELTAAVAVRRAEMDARVVPLENAYKTQGEALRELVSLARENAKGNEQLLVRIAKIEGKLDAYGEKLTDRVRAEPRK